MKALEGIKILDFTHVQSGPTCTQLLAWFGADVIKVERPGVGDATRKQLVDVPGADSLYFTMLNHNKRSIELNSKNETGKEVLTRMIEECDVLVENFAPGALDRMGFGWERIQEINHRIIMASIKGFGPGEYEDCKVYENIAQCAGGSASTTGFRDGPPLVTGAQIGDSGTGLHLCLGIVTALFQREKSGRGQKVTSAMQDSVLNLARVKLRDQQRLAVGPLEEYSQHGEGIPFGEAVPRAGNDSGGGQPGRILKCKGWEQDPDAYTYFIIQAAVWEKVCDVIGEPDWKTAEGSLSTGKILALYFLASFIINSPAITIGSLFANAMVLPAFIDDISGSNPTLPTKPLIIKSAGFRLLKKFKPFNVGDKSFVPAGILFLILS